jgi:hypothetical protein
LLIFVLSLTAYKSSNSKNNLSSASSVAVTNTITPAMELAVGTLKLEGTNEAVDQELASQLLTYWQIMDELNNNAAAAQQETSAVLEKIQGLMTTGQVNAIHNMQLTQNDVDNVMQVAGSTSVVGNTNTYTSMIPQASASGAPGGAPLAGSGGPIDGGGFGGGVMTTASSQQNTQTAQTSSPTDSTSLIEQVIKLLESKIKD